MSLTKFLTQFKGRGKGNKAISDYIDSVMQPAIRNNIMQKEGVPEDFYGMRIAQEKVEKMLDAGKLPGGERKFADVNLAMRDKLTLPAPNKVRDVGFDEYPGWLKKQDKFKGYFNG